MPALFAIPALLNNFSAAASAVFVKVAPAVAGTGLAVAVHQRTKNENNLPPNQVPRSLETVPPPLNPQTMLPPREEAPTSTGTAKLFFQKESAAQIASQPPLWAETPDEIVFGKLKNLLSPSKNGGDGPKKPGGPNDKPPFDKAVVAAMTGLGAVNGLDLYVNSAGSEATPFEAVSAAALGAAALGLGAKAQVAIHNGLKVRNASFSYTPYENHWLKLQGELSAGAVVVGAGYGATKAAQVHSEKDLAPFAKFTKIASGIFFGGAAGLAASLSPLAGLGMIGAISLYESGGYEATREKLFTTGNSQ